MTYVPLPMAKCRHHGTFLADLNQRVGPETPFLGQSPLLTSTTAGDGTGRPTSGRTCDVVPGAKRRFPPIAPISTAPGVIRRRGWWLCGRGWRGGRVGLLLRR
jgi:hypothetical protein